MTGTTSELLPTRRTDEEIYAEVDEIKANAIAHILEKHPDAEYRYLPSGEVEIALPGNGVTHRFPRPGGGPETRHGY